MLRDFSSRVVLRTLLIGATLIVVMYMFTQPNMIFASILLCLVVVAQLAEMIRFVSQTNRKLTRFLESIKYSDFVSGFAADHKLGKSFKDLNESINDVMEAFRKARSEKEESWQYLDTVVQQVRTGILSFDSDGKIQLINNLAKKYLGTNTIKNIEELKMINPRLYETIQITESGKGELYKANNDIQLSVQCTHLRIRGVDIKLLTMQNIQGELQKQEAEAWQNLTRVLRHEIMNSITPISSLTSTLREILEHDLKKENENYVLNDETTSDLKEGLSTIENRSKGLIKFIDAYREYTSLPKPTITTVNLKNLIEKVSNLMKEELKRTSIEFSYACSSDYLTIQVDEEMIEQVLINLLKNAKEALQETKQPKLNVLAHYQDNAVKIEITDNGPGIIKEAIENIFVPFYTTKRTGSGIGLSLSRQIMQLHGGSLTVVSEPEVQTTFTLRF
ncbi:MAG: ATP-binding protein [Cyclobacteriaceae bacterium]|jgi:two-component system nitrogen regulation sensor histidine kinase NtrY|nr:ATP-binding protein [Cytophagales bacterium]MCZ8327465.1 ATP-binding protein [Cyclobacteriaceae bacterium]